MKTSNIILGGFGAVVLGVTILATGAFAYQGGGMLGANYTPERHTAMLKAFENKDFSAWKELMNGNSRVTQVVNENNFSRFAQMHQLMLDGKTAEAQAIRMELGLGQGGGQGRGMMGGQRGQHKSGNFVDANGDGKCDRMQ
jgi:hypothetical protein